MPGVPGGSSPNAVGEFYVPATAPSWSPITFQQPVDAATTVAAAEQKQVGKPLIVTATAATAMQKQINKPISVAVTASPALASRLTKLVALAAASVVTAALSTKTLKGIAITATSAVTAALATLFVKFAPKTAGRRRHEPVFIRFEVRLLVATFIEAHPPARRMAAPAVMGVTPVAPRPSLTVPWPAVVGLADVAFSVPEALRRPVFRARLTVPERPQPVALRPRIAVPDAPDDDAELIAALVAAGLM